MTGYIESDELYMVEMESWDVPSRDLRRLVADADVLAASFEKKYGKPAFSLDGPVTTSLFTPDQAFSYKKWTIGDKYIDMLLGETFEGNEYEFKIMIGHNKYPTKADPDEEARKEQARKEKEEQQKYQF